MAELKAGTRLRSNVCTTEAMVVAAPTGDVDLTCGGAPMAAIARQKSTFAFSRMTTQ